MSKAMYVMTPFTSLLVLENDQMYADFHVDRGRKDHWALYPCPARIPVLYEPLGNEPDARPLLLQRRSTSPGEVLGSIVVRVPPRPLACVPDQEEREDQDYFTAQHLYWAAHAARAWMEDDDAATSLNEKMIADLRQSDIADLGLHSPIRPAVGGFGLGGLGLGGLAHVFSGAVGISALVMASAEAFTLLKIAGTLYLIWLGLKTWREARIVEPTEVQPAGDRGFLAVAAAVWALAAVDESIAGLVALSVLRHRNPGNEWLQRARVVMLKRTTLPTP